MSAGQFELWSTVLSAINTFVLVIAGIAGGIRYFQERGRDRVVREEELAWRKTEFVLELADNFAKDEQYQAVFKLLEFGIGLPRRSTLGKILSNNTRTLNELEMEWRYSIDHYLDFFDRLYHFTFVTRSLNIPDIEVFGWNIAQIGGIREIRDYAELAGFEDVIVLYNEFHKRFGQRHWFKIVQSLNVPSESKATGKKRN